MCDDVIYVRAHVHAGQMHFSKYLLNIVRITELFDGSAEATSMRRIIQKLASTDPMFANEDDIFKDRKQLYLDGLKKVLSLFLFSHLSYSTDVCVCV